MVPNHLGTYQFALWPRESGIQWGENPYKAGVGATTLILVVSEALHLRRGGHSDVSSRV